MHVKPHHYLNSFIKQVSRLCLDKICFEDFKDGRITEIIEKGVFARSIHCRA